ncbi:MAG: hypothetical protein MUF47_12580 [Porphyrobacter sp.]|jgi:hypothetical protein|nr:hypothetical protein [Porphyrobacter sp.]
MPLPSWNRESLAIDDWADRRVPEPHDPAVAALSRFIVRVMVPLDWPFSPSLYGSTFRDAAQIEARRARRKRILAHRAGTSDYHGGKPCPDDPARAAGWQAAARYMAFRGAVHMPQVQP